jgi:hypothetical protein
MITTLFTFMFALGCLATFLCGLRKQWADFRLVSAGVAIVSFLLALLSAEMTAVH